MVIAGRGLPTTGKTRGTGQGLSLMRVESGECHVEGSRGGGRRVALFLCLTAYLRDLSNEDNGREKGAWTAPLRSAVQFPQSYEGSYQRNGAETSGAAPSRKFNKVVACFFGVSSP